MRREVLAELAAARLGLGYGGGQGETPDAFSCTASPRPSAPAPDVSAAHTL